MSKNIYGASTLTGGTTGALDAIDGSLLADGDSAVAFVQGDKIYNYILNATSGATASSPYIIQPATNAGTKRWILFDSYKKSYRSYITSQVNITSNTTLATLTDLTSQTLEAGKVYSIEGTLFVTNTVNNGIKLAFATADTLTATSIISDSNIFSDTGSLIVKSRSTTLTGSLGAVTAKVDRIDIVGCIVVGTAGKLALKVAQNTSHSDTLSVLVGSKLGTLLI